MHHQIHGATFGHGGRRALQNHRQQRAGVLAQHHGVALQLGEDLGRALAARKVAGSAVVEIDTGTQRHVWRSRLQHGGSGLASFIRSRSCRAAWAGSCQLFRGGFGSLAIHGLDKLGHGVQVCIRHVLHGVLNHHGHFAIGHCVSITARCQIGSDLFGSPLLNTRLLAAQGWGGPAVHLATRQEAGVGQTCAALRHQSCTGAVAGSAVACAFHQVLTANLLVVTAHGLELGFTRQGQPVPGTNAKAHVEREAQAGGLHRILHRLDFGLQVVIQRTDIAFLHEAIVLVRHGGVQLLTVVTNAIHHGGTELVQSPVTDTGFLVRRDVGRPDGAHGAVDAVATGQRLAALGGVAGHAVASAHDVFATARFSLPVGRQFFIGRCWLERCVSQRHCRDDAQNDQGNHNAEDFLHSVLLPQTSGRGFFKYRVRMACSVQYARPPTMPVGLYWVFCTKLPAPKTNTLCLSQAWQ